MDADLANLWSQCQADTPERRVRLYGLFLLRSPQYKKVAAYILSPGENYGYYSQRLGFVHENYASIISLEEPLTLQPILRVKMRQHLLTMRQNQEMKDITRLILQKVQRRIDAIEESTPFPDIRMRVKNDMWMMAFQELLEAQLWCDSAEAIMTALPVFLAASLYHPDLLPVIYEQVAFFGEQIASPQREWWELVSQSFNMQEQGLRPGQMAQGLRELNRLLTHKVMGLPERWRDYQTICLAALHWQEGELFREVSQQRALDSFDRALSLLYREEELPQRRVDLYWILAQMAKEAPQKTPDEEKRLLLHCMIDNPAFFQAYARLGYLFYEIKDFRQALTYFHYAIELQSDHAELWAMLGIIHAELKNYARALDELHQAIALDPSNPFSHYNRASVYERLREYKAALADYSRALELDPALMEAYMNRGNMYAMLKDTERARMDYEEALRLQPTDIDALWQTEWISFGKQRITEKKARDLQAIAEQHPNHYLAQVCQGLFAGTAEYDLPRAIEAMENACQQASEQWDPPFWLAMVLAYRNLKEQAGQALQRALDLGLPVALLLPLYWLENDAPDFFQHYALPVLLRHQL